MYNDGPHMISARQPRATRALLGIDQTELAGDLGADLIADAFLAARHLLQRLLPAAFPVVTTMSDDKGKKPRNKKMHRNYIRRFFRAAATSRRV